jgi:drug/metabolite transporter, DME family
LIAALLRSGVFFALAAALLNSSIAIFSKFLLTEMSSDVIAFYKAALGALVLWIALPRQSAGLKWQVAVVCAFFGIFCLFFFETAAYQHEQATNVVFCMMACAALTAFVFEAALEKRRPSRVQGGGLLLCVLGMALLLDVRSRQGTLGSLLAAFAGLGYGVFTVLAKRWRLGSSLYVTRALLSAGAVFLLGPAVQAGLTMPSAQGWLFVVLLAILPSMLGCYCTTRAVALSSPTRVRICELAEPVFVMLASQLIF